MSVAAMITASGICRSFGGHPVLRGVDLVVPRGRVVALLGPNGAGKTTLIRILATLLRADAGTATVAGYDVEREPEQVRRSMSLTGQYAAVDELLTGRENLRLMAGLRRLPRAAARSRTTQLLDEFDLVDAADRRVALYSGGMRRRLDLAIGLVTRPPVLFLDEPTTGLDPRSRQTMWDIVGRLVADGTTILLTTQYLEEADQLADRIVVLDGGRVLTEGTADELKHRVEVERVELSFASATAYAAATTIITGDLVIADPLRRVVSVPTDGTAASLKDLLDRLACTAIAVERVALRRPTLDDVFRTLTGAR